VIITANDVTPSVRVLMAVCDEQGDPKAFFTVGLLEVEDWIAGGYRAVAFDPDDWFAYVRWKAAQPHG
jgi:hypothetical protein